MIKNRLALMVVFYFLAMGIAFAQNVTIKAQRKPLKELVTALQQLTGYNFIYNSDLLTNALAVDVAYTNTPFKTVLDQCFAANGINYTINPTDKTVVLSAPVKPAVAKAPAVKQLQGLVTDGSGNALAGVTVAAKNTKTLAMTNNDGAFTINVPDNVNTLVFSFVGYEPQEATIGADSRLLRIVLRARTLNMEGVIVIGYGTQKRSTVTGAVASLSADAITERAISRVDQALVGQLAGVNVRQTTGMPGKGFSVQVRGNGSISANTEPLYVVDGFPLSQSQQDGTGNFSVGNALDNINPEDIESIEVLKDAAAAAIYGSRASNGVVLITTKRGKVGKAKIQVSGSAGFSEAARKVDMLSGEEWTDRATEMINAAYVNAYGARGAIASDDMTKRVSIIGTNNIAYIPDPRWAQPGHPGLQYVDWQDAIFRKGLQQNYQLSASGGTNNINYFFSVNNINQEGMVIGTSNNLYSARANVEASFNQKLKIGINLAPSYSVLKDPGVEGKDVIFHQALNMTPVVEDTAGLATNAFRNNPYNWAVQFNSPVEKALNQVGETKRFRTVASIYGIYTITKGLTFKTAVNVDHSNITYARYTPYTVTNLLSVRNSQTTINTSGGYNTNNYQAFVNENTLNYTTDINKAHNLNVLLGQSYNSFFSNASVMSSLGGYTHPNIQTLNYAAGVTGRTTATKNALVSYFSRVQYAYKNKYLASASIRTDGSSRFGANTKYGVFPAASLGWKLSEEEFIRNRSTISDLKLRVTYGVTGNNSIGDFNAIPTTASYGYVFGATQAAVIGQAPNRVANPDLTWEKSATLDIGLDFGIFRNRITGSLDYYDRITKDLLLNVAVPEVTGFQTNLSNVGRVRNMGWEAQVASKNVVGKFQWTTNVQISYNKNKVLSLGSGQSQLLVPSLYTTVANTVLKVGEPINSIYVIKQTGILTQDDMNSKVALYGTQTVGDAKYEDFDNSGVIDAGDRQIVGHPNPDYTWGITNTFNYKGFDCRILIQGQMGGSIYSLLGRAVSQTGFGYIYNQLGDYRNRWRSPDDPGNGMRGKAYSTFGSIVNTDWLYSSNYFRVRTITLGYDMKRFVLKKTPVASARVFASLENFFGKDKYYGGANPESANTDLSGNGNYPQSGDYGGLPLPRSFIMGVNLSF